MKITPLHRKMMEIGFGAGEELGLVLAGGYAVQAHDLVERPSKDVDFATGEPLPLPEIVDRLVGAYQAVGFQVRTVQVTPRMARLWVETPDGGCEVDLLKEALQPPVRMEFGPVVSFEDAVGLKVRALYGRSVHRDLIDVHAASAYFSWPTLESLCRRHQPEFTLPELADRLDASEFLADEDFHAYGLDEGRIAEIRRWAIGWRDDIELRLASDPEGPSFGSGRFDWESYVNDDEAN